MLDIWSLTPNMKRMTKALYTRAFFLCLIIVLASAADASLCRNNTNIEVVRVERVTDGDSLRLTNDTSVRLIGINAPELGKDGGPNEPKAATAKQRLSEKIKANGWQVGLQKGSDRKDRYGRTLAHLFDASGGNINAELLQQGMAYFIAVPPNINLIDCYQKAELTAQEEGLGVWSDEASADHRTQLKGRGFRLILSAIKQVEVERHNIWIHLENGLTLRVKQRDMIYFDQVDWSNWLGETIEVRGWIFQRKGHPRMNLRHPAMLRKLASKQH